jgi:multisubunit Na+/H+ antiporter MnhB subunit
MGDLLLDPVIGAALVWLAWHALHGQDLFRSVVLFMAFGLLMALMWARLGAPDIALAEAAIGAGLSGALLISAVTRLGPQARQGDEEGAPGARSGRMLAASAALAVAGVGLWSAWPLDPSAGDLPGLVASRLPESEVGHPVTAVLLNFRAYDTWLEVVVLLVALVGVRALREERAPAPSGVGPSGGGVLAGAVPILLPLMVLVGGYFLWRGTHAPGGAFQAGAVIGSAAVLAILAGRWDGEVARRAALRLAGAAGAIAFLLAAGESALRGRAFLELPPGYAGPVILLLEVAVTTSIALTLAGLFTASSAPLAFQEAPAPEAVER